MDTAQIRLVQPYFEAVAERHLVLPQCGHCHRFHWYPKFRCPHCRVGRWEWTDAGTSGTVFAFTTVQHRFEPTSSPPFTIGLIEPDQSPGVRLVTRLIDIDPDRVRIGLPVSIDFQPVRDGGPVLPVFRPVVPQADSGGGAGR